MPTTQVALRQQVSEVGGGTVTVTNITAASYTATQTNGVLRLLCDTTSNSITVNLPTAVGNTCEVVVKRTASANTLTVDAISNGSSWAII
jgi:hypothetical protein